jgi:hypothetical protein
MPSGQKRSQAISQCGGWHSLSQTTGAGQPGLSQGFQGKAKSPDIIQFPDIPFIISATV